MKKIFLLILLSLSFSCNTKPITMPTIIPTETAESTKPTVTITTPSTAMSLIDRAEIVDLLPEEYIDELGIRFHLISPDGEKISLKFPIFEINEQPLTLVQVISSTNKEFVSNYEVPLDRPHTYYYFYSWSPDSTAFVGGFYDANKFSGGEWCCGEGIAISNLISEESQTSIYSWDWNYANRIYWSSDSSKLSVTFNTDEYSTLIIDRYGNLLKTFRAGEKTAFWSENILYYTKKRDEKVELWNFDSETQESSLALDDFKEFNYIAQNENLNEIFLTKIIDKLDGTNSTTKTFYIFDTNTKVIKEIEPPSSTITWTYPWISSPSAEFVALKAVFDWGEVNHLWIFDWKTHEIKDYGKIKDLFGWFENHDGFLVTSVEGIQRIIKP